MSPSQDRGSRESVSKMPPTGNHLIAYVDGGARGNPGPAGFGVVITDHVGHKVAALSEYVGHQTNNFAEYSGLIAALQFAAQHPSRAVKVISDSQLIVNQIRGVYKVNHPALQELYRKASGLIAKLDWFSIQHVLREKNREADRLANEAMDKGMGRSTTLVRNQSKSQAEEFEGVVRDGVIEIEGGMLPEGTRVQVRVKR
jgi:ribonuclease HI